eukprot:3941384-Rhodomonas_salina.3
MTLHVFDTCQWTAQCSQLTRSRSSGSGQPEAQAEAKRLNHTISTISNHSTTQIAVTLTV